MEVGGHVRSWTRLDWSVRRGLPVRLRIYCRHLGGCGAEPTFNIGQPVADDR
jgi:hypothetical protein